MYGCKIIVINKHNRCLQVRKNMTFLGDELHTKTNSASPSGFGDHHLGASLVEEFPKLLGFQVNFRIVFHLLLGLQSLQRPEVGGGSLVPQRGEVEPALRGSHQLVHDRLPQGARQREGAAVRESQSREERRLVTQHRAHGKFRTPVR